MPASTGGRCSGNRVAAGQVLPVSPALSTTGEPSSTLLPVELIWRHLPFSGEKRVCGWGCSSVMVESFMAGPAMPEASAHTIRGRSRVARRCCQVGEREYGQATWGSPCLGRVSATGILSSFLLPTVGPDSLHHCLHESEPPQPQCSGPGGRETPCRLSPSSCCP